MTAKYRPSPCMYGELGNDLRSSDCLESPLQETALSCSKLWQCKKCSIFHPAYLYLWQNPGSCRNLLQDLGSETVCKKLALPTFNFTKI